MEFRKKTYSLRTIAQDGLRLARKPRSLFEVFVANRDLAPDVREAIMVSIASANECRYCLYIHSEWAQQEGLSPQLVETLTGDLPELPPRFAGAIAYARAYHATGFKQIAQLRAPLVDQLGEELVASIETTAEAMHLANLTGNTFDALLARMRGMKTGGRLLDEVAVSAIFCTAAVPISFSLGIRWRKSPLRMVRQILRDSGGLFGGQVARPPSSISGE